MNGSVEFQPTLTDVKSGLLTVDLILLDFCERLDRTQEIAAIREELRQ